MGLKQIAQEMQMIEHKNDKNQEHNTNVYNMYLRCVARKRKWLGTKTIKTKSITLSVYNVYL